MRHVTHFLWLNIFQQIGFCSTKVRNSIVFLSSSAQVEEFLQLQQSSVSVQKSVSRQNLRENCYFDTTETLHFTWGLWNCGIEWQGKDTKNNNKKCASFLIVASYWNLKIPEESIFKTTKYRALCFTNTYARTYTSFCFKNELCNANTEIRCRSKTAESYTN